MADVISSAANPLVKRVRGLEDRKHRRRESAFVVQGIQPVWQAVEAGAAIEVLIIAPDLLRHAGAAAMVAAQEAAGVRVAQLSGELFGRIAERDAPSGLAAIVRSAPVALANLVAGHGSLFAALHTPGNPGNVGTIIRTASAVGCDGVILIGPSADQYDPAAVKASMGAIFAVPVATASSAGEFLDWARQNAVTVAATSARGSVSCWEAELTPPLAVLLGSEGAGLARDLLAAADLEVAIPMTGTAESLNLAVAAGVLLYEVRRRTGLPSRA
ncbi:MAG TPA: RNA methyltransferase [Streptosporangiaceae bacterium]|nr:RNA methyltransferase [Streptosporangiaceae bacterium]